MIRIKEGGGGGWQIMMVVESIFSESWNLVQILGIFDEFDKQGVFGKSLENYHQR